MPHKKRPWPVCVSHHDVLVSTNGEAEETGNLQSDKVAVRSDPEIRPNGILPWREVHTEVPHTRQTLRGLVGKSRQSISDLGYTWVPVL